MSALAIGGVLAVLTLGSPAGTPLLYEPAPVPVSAGPEVALAESSPDAITLDLLPPGGRPGEAEVELLDLGGKLLAKVTVAQVGKPFQAKLTARVNTADPANYYVRYRFNAGEAFRQRSLHFLSELLETCVLGQREFLAGTSPVVRIMVRDRAAGVPVAGAKVRVVLAQGEKEICSTEARTDARGEVAARLQLPAGEFTGARLKVSVQSRTARDTVEEAVNVKSAVRTLLTTDKPLYQPGQTIHLRALALQRPGMKPLAGAGVLFEVDDAKGNKVFKQPVQADDFGVSHADFVLADELNMGSYRVRAVVAGAKEEKTVTVYRYVLPKFKNTLVTDRPFYQPGETIKAELQVNYFFGKAVAGGKVHVKCSKFDVGYFDFQVLEGQTDAEGHFSFEVKLPASFVGQPLEAGKASAKLEIAVTDTADHKETITKNVAVTAAPILVTAVPESGELVPGLENRIYVVTTYADSTPARCQVSWLSVPGPTLQKIQTDEAGFGQFIYRPDQAGNIPVTLFAQDEKGQEGRASLFLNTAAKTGDDTILLRTDRSLYRVGQRAKLVILTTRKAGTVYLDFIKDRQTYLTRSVEVNDGRAADTVTFDPTLAGTVQINAYLIGENGEMMRDRRLVIVDPADDLKVSIRNDAETYLPGGEAQVSFRVTNASGRGVVSALGVMVVDEAVFALQEMQPGLEKIYFYLEKEIATPRYEVHGWSLDQSMEPGEASPESAARRDTAARVLLASAKGVGDYTLRVDTYKRDNKAAAFQAKMAALLAGRWQTVAQAVRQFGQKHHGDAQRIEPKDLTIQRLVKEGLLKQADALDPWGTPMKIVGGAWSPPWQTFWSFSIASAGIDGQWSTADDITYAPPVMVEMEIFADVLDAGGAGRWMAEGKGEMPAEKFAGNMLAAPAAKDAAPGVLCLTGANTYSGGNTISGGALEPVRVREYFPETLYFNPAVITDHQGNALLRVPLADSITTWRLTCMASSARGRLGSATAGINVFQDFFVDIDFPVALTQHDEVSVPVAVYNYLKTDQAVRLEVTPGDWFELRPPAVQTLTLGPGEVRAVHFPIVARKIGFQKFTVTARGAHKSDAVARSVEVVPDGKEFLVSQSGRLEGKIAHTIDIPPEAIQGASKIFVKVYPGMMSQVVEGLDKMLRMPGGCFEQTSSSTYPNVLVLDYMKTSGKITPELQMKAEGFINAGYQRLVSFEVPGGGFEWFGRAPAHSILTAYGLMEFYDMSKVHAVDPGVIARTQQWLARLQQSDGSFRPSMGGIAEGAINKMQDNILRNTAYTVWALASTEYKGPELPRGADFLRGHLDEMKDNYTLALAANALATVAPQDDATVRVLALLRAACTEKDGLAFWSLQSDTPTFGSGAAGDIEVTALAVQALIRGGRELGIADKAVAYLAKNKDAFGTWQSTQATIQALRAMLMAERGATASSSGSIDLRLNGKAVKTLRIDQSNSDVLQLVDLKELTIAGPNVVALEFQGTGGLLYQVVGRYYLPYARGAAAAPEAEPLGIQVRYDRTNLDAEDVVGVTATVTNNRGGSAQMVIVDLGLPPGFTPVLDMLNRAVAEKQIEKYSVTGRQIIVYLRQVTVGQPVELHYQLLAKYPLKAQTGKSVAYQYYNPAAHGESNPVQLTVAAKK
ncbi:MAG: MG2 domain-containing protein [Thermoguttaceae bacterium]